MLPDKVEHWSLTTLRMKLIKIGAKVVRHGRYVTFKMAEFAVPRDMFREILRLIDGLRRSLNGPQRALGEPLFRQYGSLKSASAAVANV